MMIEKVQENANYKDTFKINKKGKNERSILK